MFKIFSGGWRGPGGEHQDEIFINLGVAFRQYLHHFKGAKLHVFMAIALHMDETGKAFPSYDTLERETGYGRDTIARALDGLCKTVIDGTPVLLRWRERDEEMRYTSGNIYIVFPTAEEVSQAKSHSWENPNSGLSNSKEIHVSKDEPSKTSGADAPEGGMPGKKNPTAEQDDEPPQDVTRPSKEDLDGLFDAIAEGSFGVTDKSLYGPIGGRVGKIRKAFLKYFPEHRAEDLRAFYDWYRDTKQVNAPADPDKVLSNYAEFWQDTPTGVGMRLDPATGEVVY